MAATGVSLVVERVSQGDGGPGKWVRTGDVQRFRVRLNGMAKGARVAVAASPVEALSEVACVSPAGQPSHPALSSPLAGPLGSSSVGAAPPGSASVGAAPFAPEYGGPPLPGPASAGPAPHGAASDGLTTADSALTAAGPQTDVPRTDVPTGSGATGSGAAGGGVTGGGVAGGGVAGGGVAGGGATGSATASGAMPGGVTADGVTGGGVAGSGAMPGGVTGDGVTGGGVAGSGAMPGGVTGSGAMPGGATGGGATTGAPMTLESGEDGLSAPTAGGGQGPVPGWPPATGAATAGASPVPALPARVLATRALAAIGTPALPYGSLLGAHVCRLGKVDGERSVDVTLTTPEGARKVVLAAVAEMRAEPDDGRTTMRRSVAMRVIGTAPPISGDAAKLADPQARRTAEAEVPDVELTLRQVAPQQTLRHMSAPASPRTPAQSVPAASGGAVASSSIESVPAASGKAVASSSTQGVSLDQALPDVLQQGLADVPTVGASPAPGTTPSPQIAALSGTEAAPLPWEMAAATKRARPTGQGNPLKGPMGHAMVVGGIGTLLGALWLIVTVQKHRRRRMVL
ncbi:hypothetical protein [Nonomuraea turcica]|uniref:hypothetical protein n=1 Tax=Nonomuraea sp. G32 TaxID=3067274 RepID=UPI00273AC42F|nr:hypothetical protein [Nonomuraea sp. G32]MDP4507334.1 hypothetical protein [Nonomuraea sp. G32]